MTRPPIKRNISAEAVRSLLDYDPATGIFRWRGGRRGGDHAGRIAGAVKDGYVYIIIAGRFWLAHRLAWLHYYGRHAGDMLDHINRVRNDNRIANLREVTPRESRANTAPARPSNRIGFGGAYERRGKWRAQISHRGQCICLGTFASKDEALSATAEARTRIIQQTQQSKASAS